MSSQSSSTAAFVIFMFPVLLLLCVPFFATPDDEVRRTREFRPLKPVVQQSVELAGKAPELVSDSAPVKEMVAVDFHNAKKAERGLAGGEASRADFRLVGDDSISMESREATEKAWEYFKKQDWEMSKSLFVKALDTGSENAPAVRGLVMSVYRGNSAGDAYDLAKELDSVVPGVDEMVLEAISGDVETLLMDGKVDEAEQLLAQIPASDEPALGDVVRAVLHARE